MADLDSDIVEIQDEYHASWRLKKRWIIIENDDGTFTVHQHTADSVYPPTDYPTKRLAAARLLQLLELGPVGPQSHPESVCIHDDQADFGWVPPWLSDPPPPTPKAMRGAETLSKLPTPIGREP